MSEEAVAEYPPQAGARERIYATPLAALDPTNSNHYPGGDMHTIFERLGSGHGALHGRRVLPIRALVVPPSGLRPGAHPTATTTLCGQRNVAALTQRRDLSGPLPPAQAGGGAQGAQVAA